MARVEYSARGGRQNWGTGIQMQAQAKEQRKRHNDLFIKAFVA
jgi:hypothetical protein